MMPFDALQHEGLVGTIPVLLDHPELTPDELREWLEWAGAMLLALQISSPKPRGLHTSWPEYANDSRIAYGYTQERLRAAIPSSHEIALMDDILLLPNFISDIAIRRIVNSRMLVAPISRRYVFTWTKIAFILHSDRRKIMRLYDKGLDTILEKLPLDKAYVLRQRLHTLNQ